MPEIPDINHESAEKNLVNKNQTFQKCATDKLLYSSKRRHPFMKDLAEDILKIKKIFPPKYLEKLTQKRDSKYMVKSFMKDCFSKNEDDELEKEQKEENDRIAMKMYRESDLKKDFLIEVLIEEAEKRENIDLQRLIQKAGFQYQEFIKDPEVQDAARKKFLDNLEERNEPTNESLQKNIPIINFAEFQKTSEYKNSSLKGFTDEISSLHSLRIDADDEQEDYFDYATKLYNSLLSLGCLSNEIFEKSIKKISSAHQESFSLVKFAEIFENIDPKNFFEFKKSPQIQYLAKTEFIRLLLLSDRKSTKYGELMSRFNLNDKEDWSEIVRIYETRNPKIEEKLTDQNWIRLLSAYIRTENIDAELEMNLKKEDKDQIKEIFRNPENKEFCLNKFRELWKNFLLNPNFEFDIQTMYLTSLIAEFYAGELKYIEDLGLFMNQIQESFATKTTTTKTKAEIITGLQEQEKRFEKERRTNEDKTLFYQISTDILEAAPSLYADFLKLFQKLDNKKMREFQKELFPLFQAQLVLLQESGENNDSEEIYYNSRNLVQIRNNLKNFSETLNFDEQKTKILEFLKKQFGEKFGLIKIPEVFDQEKVRSLQNIIRYLGNINERDHDKEEILSLFLALKINNEWQNFRLGKEIKLAEYFQPEKIEFLQEYLDRRKELNILTAEKLGLDETELPLFQEKLQKETVSILIGNIQTIDQKLINISKNIKELNDPDIFSQKENQILMLLSEHGKLVGAILAKTYQDLSGKKIFFSEEERNLQNKINVVLEDTLTLNNIKEIQSLISLLNPIISINKDIESENLPDELNELNSLLQPSSEIIKIFNHLGEDFTPTSGAMALSQDLTYLETVIVKNENKINPDEKIILEKYLASIKNKMRYLEGVLEKIKTRFNTLSKQADNISNPILKDRLGEIKKIIYSSDENSNIISSITNDPNVIIENMRQCLGCLKKENNNDTNLTFGDMNKFYVYSKTPEQKENESIADEIIFLQPIKIDDNNEELSFVFDHIYGNKSSDILISHIAIVFKKYQEIKKNFPNIKLSLFITNPALQSVGFDFGLLTEKLKDLEEFKLEKVKLENMNGVVVNVIESASGDHYIEFGGDSRTSGERKVDGVIITI